MTPETRFANRFCKAFESAGWTTINMESLGDGVPDRLIAKQGKAFLIETKIKGNYLTKSQYAWISKQFKNNLPFFTVIKEPESIILVHIIYRKEFSWANSIMPFSSIDKIIFYFEGLLK